MPSALKRPASPTPTSGPDSPRPFVANASKSKKRKLGTPHETPSRLADSPAPQEHFPADTAPDGPTPLSPFDLSGMAKNRVARLPTFTPIAEGSQFYLTPDIPSNRSGYRYVAGWSTPDSKIVDRTGESPPQHVSFSWEDRSIYVGITQDAMAVSTQKGFRSARCNVPVREGKWYVEMQILKGGGEGKGEAGRLDGAHVRLGWGRREAPLNGPVGMDGYSYGMRDLTGEKVTLSRPKPYGRSFRSGDVIGMYISLPPRRKPNAKDLDDPALLARKRIPILWKGQVYYESLDYKQSKEMASLMDYSGKSAAPAVAPKKSGPGKGPPGRKEQNQGPVMRALPVLHGSTMAFFVNGECQGTAFRDVYDYLQLRLSPAAQKANAARKGVMDAIMKERENNFDDGSLGYYPFVSVFNDAQVRINPGPDFIYPPPADIDSACGLPPSSKYGEQAWRPLCERYHEFLHEMWEQDAIDAIEANADAERQAKEAEEARMEETKKQERLQKNRERAAQRKKEKAAAMSTKKDNAVPHPSASPDTTRPTQPADDLDATLLSFVTSPRYTGRPDDIDSALLEVVASPRKPAVEEPESPSPAGAGKAYDFTDSEDDRDMSERLGASAGGSPAPEDDDDDDEDDDRSRAEDSEADEAERESVTEGDEGAVDAGIDAELALLME